LSKGAFAVVSLDARPAAGAGLRRLVPADALKALTRKKKKKKKHGKRGAQGPEAAGAR
jgi:hypothetical protein